MAQQETNITTPKRRFQLHARIIGTGHRTMKEFADNIGMDLATMSRVVNGWETPGPRMQQRLAKHLSISLKELSTLL